MKLLKKKKKKKGAKYRAKPPFPQGYVAALT